MMENKDISIMIHCELCGKETEDWLMVSDCDPTVGYHGHVEICRECEEFQSNPCGQCGRYI